MAFMDNSLAFQPSTPSWSTAQSFTSTATGTHVVDVIGAGVGTIPAMVNTFPSSAYQKIGFDIGAGDGVAIPYLYVAFTSVGTSANTITVALWAAPDSGSGGTEGSYTLLYQSPALTESALAAGDVLLVPVPPIQVTEGEALPRFYKIVYTCSSTVAVSVLAGLMINPPNLGLPGQYPNRFLAV